MAALTLDDLFASPDHYLHSFEGDAALFVPMDRAAYRRSIFLDQRIAPARPGSMRLPLATLAGGRARARATSWIFHIAHCGSTLLARALEGDANLVLREPLALRQTAVTPDPARLALTLAMLGKRYDADRPTIVKANVPVNFIAQDITVRDRDARAILLHLPLRDYAAAILRTQQHREWLRRVTGQLARHLGDLSTLPDAELAAALWLAQMRTFARLLAVMPRARSLNAESFFADPGGTLTAAAAHLAASLSAATVAETVAGPLFATYSKNPDQPFDNAARVARAAATAAALVQELAAAEAWCARQPGAAEAETAVTAARLA